MKAASGASTQMELSQRCGHRRDAIANGVSRNNKEGGLVGFPLREAVQLALEDGHSLDWLILGRGEPQAEPSGREVARDTADGVTDEGGDYDAAPSADVIRSVVTGVEAALAETRVSLSPEKKADLVATLVAIYADARTEPNRDHIMQLVRTAS